MPAPDWENLDAFLSLDDFAVRARLFLTAGIEKEISVIFDEAFLDTLVGEYALETSQPRIMAKEADVLGLRRGDQVEIAGIRYDVMRGPQEDGVGMATVVLSRVAM